jgi:hypothetical protein
MTGVEFVEFVGIETHIFAVVLNGLINCARRIRYPWI